jgi:hypothetical protein
MITVISPNSDSIRILRLPQVDLPRFGGQFVVSLSALLPSSNV